MNRRLECDVAVIGGGIAGVAAAMGAAASGARTLLLEREPYMGGMAAAAGVAAFCGLYADSGRRIVRGVSDAVLDELQGLGESTEPEMSQFGHLIVRFDCEALKLALDRALAASGAGVLFHASAVSAERRGRAIESIGCTDGDGAFRLEAKAFVDATGDAELANLAGCRTLFGDGGKVQAATLVMRLGGVDKNAGFTADDVGKALKQASDAGFGPFSKLSSAVWPCVKGDTVSLMLANCELKSLSSEDMTAAEKESRELVNSYFRALRAYMPGLERSYLVQSGPRLGIRESRRIVCRKLLRTDDVLEARLPEDTVALGGWQLEKHDDVKRCSSQRAVAGSAFYGIPEPCLHAEDAENLWCCGRDIYAEREALASARVMGTGFATGHAAGAAAALASSGRPGITELRSALALQGALLC